jgi:hypothetical protein
MSDDLHRSVWTAYRQAAGGDPSANAASAFQLAVDVVLRHRPGVDASSACSEAARMIMMRPRGLADRVRRLRPRSGPIAVLPMLAPRERTVSGL